jgi:putative ABC transport system substrate-binding protein
MDRRAFLATAASGLAATLPYAQAEDRPKIPVLGFLALAGVNTERQMRETLRDLGYVDGRNIAIRDRPAKGVPERLPALAEELVRIPVDLIVATGPQAVRAAKTATRTIPIVAVDLETDPVQSGLAQSLARPGGNLTGFFLDLPDLAGKWLELLATAAPAARPVGVLWDSTSGNWQLTAAQSAAGRFGLELYTIEFHSEDDVAAALRKALAAGVKSIVMLSSPITSIASQRIADFANRSRLPAISPFRAFADRGGLMSYGPNLLDFARRATAYVDKILKGAKPDELPIQQPTKFELVINLKTAKAIGVSIPQSLLLRAEEVIQ